MYVGVHGVANHLMQIMEVACELRNHEDIIFVPIGDGMKKPKLIAKVQEYRLTNIQFIDSQPESRIGDFINAADICTAVMKKKLIHLKPCTQIKFLIICLVPNRSYLALMG